MSNPKLYRLAEIVGFHGLDGTMKITPFYKGFSLVTVECFYLNERFTLSKIDCRFYKDFFYLKTAEINQPKAILKNQILYTTKNYLTKLPYPLFEEVINKDFIDNDSGQLIGRYYGYQYYGEQLTYLLQTTDHQEFFLPAIKGKFIVEINDRQVLVDRKSLS